MHAMRCWQIFEPLLLFEVSKQKTKNCIAVVVVVDVSSHSHFSRYLAKLNFSICPCVTGVFSVVAF